ncbi:hypothetical protein ACS0TY_018751 [Phlomoides rotata]
MAFTSVNHLLHFLTAITLIPATFTASVIEDLDKLQPPPDFNSTITNNCITNPSLRYCNSTPFDLVTIFKFTIVASHLCNVSNNPNCVESFPKIDLHSNPKIAPLYLSFSFFWKFCPLTILSIDLSNNSLKGFFPTEIFYCSQIQALDLSHNNLSGDFPVYNLSIFTNLTFLNLSYNRFSECRASETRFFERFNSSSFVHSGILPDHRELRMKGVVLFVGFPVFVMGSVVFLGWFCFFRTSFHQFRPSILKEATDGFSKRNLVGESGGGSLYRGVLRDGSEVRIEVYMDGMSGQEIRRFEEHSKILVQLHHRNIVKVLGWCNSRRLRAMVTDWIDAERSVERWLVKCVPPWKQRVKVVLGIAAGICYLQEEWPDVRCNLETRNVLLSEDGEPLMTRFKLDDHHSSTKRVYRFGMFLLEMVTNRRTREEFEKKEMGFREWVRLNYPEKLENLIDTRMKKTVEIVSEASEIIELGLICTDSSSRKQPSWDRVCDILSNTLSTKTLDRRTSHVCRDHKHEHRRDH